MWASGWSTTRASTSTGLPPAARGSTRWNGCLAVTQKCLRRRSVDSVAALQQAISGFLDRRNENPKPLRWKATAVDILRKVKRAWTTLHDRYGANKPSAALASIDRF